MSSAPGLDRGLALAPLDAGAAGLGARPWPGAADGSSARRSVVILGSTGSIGTQAVDVLLRHRERFTVAALAAGRGRPEELADQWLTLVSAGLGTPVVAVPDGTTAERVFARLEVRLATERLGTTSARPEMSVGPDAPTQVAGMGADLVLNGMAGAAGLLPTLAAIRAGSLLALANKESLIIGAPVVRAAGGAGRVIPVDSEHSALAQALTSGHSREVRRLVLTASGGPFRGRTRAELATVTAAAALQHPTWAMGPLVTVNSATLMNKGLEVIEARELFGAPMERIEVVVHPQSVVHSMVEFLDGSTLLQASPPDMRIPIALGVGWPHRLEDAAPACDWRTAAQWTFEPLDEEVFRAVALAKSVGTAGGTVPAVFNGANEVCVERFLAGGIGFLEIVDTVAEVVARHTGPTGASVSVEDVLGADQWARRTAGAVLDARAR